MKDFKIKKIETKTVLFWIMNILIFMIINSATIAFITMLFMDGETTFVYDKLGQLIEQSRKSFFFTEGNLEFKVQATIFLFMFIGILLSFFYIKFLYKIVIRKLDIKKENLSQDKELELKRESLKMEKEKQELDILKIKAEAGLLTEKEIKKLEDRLC